MGNTFNKREEKLTVFTQYFPFKFITHSLAEFIIRYGQGATLPRLFKLLGLLFLAFYGYQQFQSNQQEQASTERVLKIPKIGDIYFFDFRLMDEALRPNEHYRLAKVVDITGEVLTLRYGDLLFANKHKAVDSIRFGQLRYSDYFQPERINLHCQDIQSLRAKGAIYLAKRPIHGKLYGNFVSPSKPFYQVNPYAKGRKEYLSGVAYLNDTYNELGAEQAFEYFQRSAALGYAQGQVGLAEMYLNGLAVDKNLTASLYWLNQAALQSHKPAILKYGIVCQLQVDCNLIDFYQQLIDSGVNLKVRELKGKLKLGNK